MSNFTKPLIGWVFILALGAPLGAAIAAAAAPAAAPAPAAASAAVAPASPYQFGGQCVEGLSMSRHVMTNCTVTWTDKDGKVYCFSSDAARKSFLESPTENLQKAQDFIAASSVESTEKIMQYFDSGDAATVVTNLIDDTTKANNGVFPYEDPLNGDHLKLAFDGIDFTRTIDGYGFFPDVKFHDAADPQKKYLIDFWVAPADGGLKVQETRIYKEPFQSDGAWTTMARQPIPWWWIPASEHPGQTEQARGWEVMSAVEEDIVKERAKDNGIFKIKDAKTGEDLKLEFVGTHQPVRKLQQDGRFFACTDFRKEGTKDQFYDVDFWVNEKNGKMTVDEVRLHKVPEKQADGSYIQVPRYNFDDLKFDIVP